MMNIYAQLSPQPLESSEIPKDVIKDQVSQIMDNKSGEDHISKVNATYQVLESWNVQKGGKMSSNFSLLGRIISVRLCKRRNPNNGGRYSIP